MCTFKIFVFNYYHFSLIYLVLHKKTCVFFNNLLLLQRLNERQLFKNIRNLKIILENVRVEFIYEFSFCSHKFCFYCYDKNDERLDEIFRVYRRVEYIMSIM